jgi:hypothetical protein
MTIIQTISIFIKPNYYNFFINKNKDSFGSDFKIFKPIKYHKTLQFLKISDESPNQVTTLHFSKLNYFSVQFIYVVTIFLKK